MNVLYAVTFKAVAVTAQQDFFGLTPADGRPLRIWGYKLGQTTELQDAQSEGLAVSIRRGMTTVGSGGSAATPQPLQDPGVTGVGFTARVNDTTKASGGTIVDLDADVWYLPQGIQNLYIPELRPGSKAVSTAERIALVLETTPADSITITGTLWVEEMN